jgi:hypothetical protein
MTLSPDPVTIICGIAHILVALYALALWSFALYRTGFLFCYCFIAATVVSVFTSVITVVLYFNPFLCVRLLGQPGWRICYYVIVIIQPVASLVAAIGSTVLVLWITKTSNQAIQRTAGSLGS